MKRNDGIPSHNTYTTMRDVLHVLGISSKRYTTTTTTTEPPPSYRTICTERLMHDYARYDNETASAYISRIDAMVDAMIVEKD